MSAYDEFAKHIAEINDLLNVINILSWDARTQMPTGGAQTRAYQQATLSRVAHDMFASTETERLLAGAEAEVASEDPDSYRVRAVRQTREAYEIFRRIPAGLVSALAELKAVAEPAWIRARAENDFSQFAPYLERMLDITRRYAEAIGYDAHPYDALLFVYEPGMTAERLHSLFEELTEVILPLLKRIQEEGEKPRTDFLQEDYPEDRQRAFALEMAQAFGYDLRRGRLDRTAHPFEISFTREDVRITTRYDRHYLPGALFGVLHEAGHALYEQNADPSLTRSALTSDFLGLYAVAGASYGMHEGQSRLWENQIGRSRVFWQNHFCRLREYFPDQLSDVDVETFYRAVNRVQPSAIRVEADEVTYNLHIALRVEIEMALLDGRLRVSELPDVWNAKMQQYLGVMPKSDAEGVLQDIHWAGGLVGSFPTYTVGNLVASQLLAAARRQAPDLDDALARGDYRVLLGWLTENVYRHARAYSPTELLQRATASALSTKPYLDYLQAKYKDVYRLA